MLAPSTRNCIKDTRRSTQELRRKKVEMFWAKPFCLLLEMSAQECRAASMKICAPQLLSPPTFTWCFVSRGDSIQDNCKSKRLTVLIGGSSFLACNAGPPAQHIAHLWWCWCQLSATWRSRQKLHQIFIHIQKTVGFGRKKYSSQSWKKKSFIKAKQMRIGWQCEYEYNFFFSINSQSFECISNFFFHSILLPAGFQSHILFDKKKSSVSNAFLP